MTYALKIIVACLEFIYLNWTICATKIYGTYLEIQRAKTSIATEAISLLPSDRINKQQSTNISFLGVYFKCCCDSGELHILNKNLKNMLLFRCTNLQFMLHSVCVVPIVRKKSDDVKMYTYKNNLLQ